MTNKTYAYKRKELSGFTYGTSDYERVYNHSCVVSKRPLSKEQQKALMEGRKKAREIWNIEQRLIKEMLESKE